MHHYSTDSGMLSGFSSDALEQLTGKKMYMSHRMRPIFPTRFTGFALTVSLKKEQNHDPDALKGMLSAIDSRQSRLYDADGRGGRIDCREHTLKRGPDRGFVLLQRDRERKTCKSGGKNCRIRCDMYIFFPVSCSSASETEATSTSRNPSSNDASLDSCTVEPCFASRVRWLIRR